MLILEGYQTSYRCIRVKRAHYCPTGRDAGASIKADSRSVAVFLSTQCHYYQCTENPTIVTLLADSVASPPASY